MRKGNVWLVALAILLPLGGWAQHADSVAARELKVVEISAAKPETFAAGSRHTRIDSAFLKNHNAGSLADVLQNATAVYVKSYGIASIAFRGTSASQTAILWNGFNLNLPSLGQADLAIIPVNSLGTVQLQHGSASSNFGSAAIGGAVLLQSETTIRQGFHTHAQQDFGSFGRKFSQLGLGYGGRKVGAAASVFRTESRNDFPYLNTFKYGKPSEKQENAATEQTGFTANLSWKANPRSSFFFRNWYTTSDFEAQPSMVAANTHARNQNRNLRSMAEWNYRSRLGTSIIKGAFFRDFMRFQDDNNKPADTDIATYQAQAEHGFIFREKLHLNLGAEAQYFNGEVDGYARPVDEWRTSLFALLRYDVFRKLTLNLNWRQAIVQGFNPAPAPTFGFRYLLLQSAENGLSWKGNATRGYRVPTLNDRYWPPGNPHLKPEESLNFETGLQYIFSGEALTTETEITAYTMRVKNWIQWSPGPSSGLLFFPQNLKEVQASGLEFSGKIAYRFSPELKVLLSGNYAFTRSIQTAIYQNSEPELLNKQLVYVPLHTASGLLQTNYKQYFFTVNCAFTGSRFPDAENKRPLPAYTLLNVFGGRNFTMGACRFQVIGRVNNLGNTVYQNYQYYATPGRNYNLSLRFELN